MLQAGAHTSALAAAWWQSVPDVFPLALPCCLQLAADKFTNTWENENDKKKLPGLLDAHHLLTYGSDARSFVDVDAVEVVKSINIELPRAIKVCTDNPCDIHLPLGSDRGHRAQQQLDRHQYKHQKRHEQTSDCGMRVCCRRPTQTSTW